MSYRRSTVSQAIINELSTLTGYGAQNVEVSLVDFINAVVEDAIADAIAKERKRVNEEIIKMYETFSRKG